MAPPPGYDFDQSEGTSFRFYRLQGRAPVAIYEDDLAAFNSPQNTEVGKAVIDDLLLFVHRNDD